MEEGRKFCCLLMWCVGGFDICDECCVPLSVGAAVVVGRDVTRVVGSSSALQRPAVP